MKLVVLGSNGYRPTDLGQTACCAIPELGVVLDAGTGIYRMVDYLLSNQLIHIYLTHAHSDHYAGLVNLEFVFRKKFALDVIDQGTMLNMGSIFKALVRRGHQTIEVELTKDYFMGFDTHTDQAKSDMREFMTKEFPDLKATIQLILAEGDMVVSLLEYRGNHANFKREAVWREAWFVRLSEGMIVEGWPVIDESSYFRHLGYQLIPPST